MSFPIVPVLAMALLVGGMGAHLWDLYRADKESEATAKIVTTLLIRPDNTLNR